jgi:hypothetical protein
VTRRSALQAEILAEAGVNGVTEADREGVMYDRRTSHGVLIYLSDKTYARDSD